MATTRLEFRILGPLAVRIDGDSVPIGGPKQRALLALLLLSANRVVSRDRLIEELFPDQSPDSADHALRNQVSRLRKVLAPAAVDEPRLVARAPGYLLRVEPGELDLDQFERLVTAGRESLTADDHGAAAESLHAAEQLWRGRPLADLEFEPFTRVDVERLEELRLAALEERIDAELALGRQLVLVPELEALGAEHPYRERFRAQLMLALYRSGRQAEGLEVYRQTRALLNDELGLEPGTELQELERGILVQDPALNPEGDGRAGVVVPRLDVCPFKGLAPFEAEDAEFFFGRERLVDELVGRLEDAPLLAIVGPSGSGKSSLLRAGLLPALEWESRVVRPNEQSASDLIGTFEQLPSDERLVLAVDQFEELFSTSLAEKERRAFVDALVEAAWDPDRRALIVIALRADFFAQLAPYVELGDLVGPNHILLGPMSTSELRRAIEGPATRTGLQIEPDLVDDLVDDVAGEPGGLPLLSTALLDLWGERDGGSLTLASYERLGGVSGAVGRHAEGAFQSLDEREQKAARRILLRLVAGGDGEALTRRRVTRAELDADRDQVVVQVLDKLVERRLLVADDGSVELVHEALLERWPRLAGWLEEDAQGRTLHRRLTQAAEAWDASDRDSGELFRGARLAATLEWADAAGEDAGLNRLERDFLKESHTASNRTNRRLRALLAVAVVLLVAALAAGEVALASRSSARHQATDAIAERLGAQALVDPSLDRSFLLAREGVNLDDSTATRSNLLAALLRSPAAIGVAREGSDRLLDEALSPDGRILAVRGDDGKVVLFDARTLRPIRTAWDGSNQVGLVGAVQGPLHGLAFSPDGRTLAVGGSDGNAATVDFVGVRGHTTRPGTTVGNLIAADVAFAPDGRTLATGEPVNGTSHPPAAVIALRDVRTGDVRAQSRPIPAGRLIGYTRGGSLLVASGARRSLLLDARTLRPERTFAVGGAGALSPASDEAAFGHSDGTVTLVNLGSGRKTTFSGRATGSIEATAFSRNGRMLATADDDGSVNVWNVRAPALTETLEGHSAPVRAVAFSPDGQTLFTGGYDGSVIAFDVGGARRLGQPFRYSSHLVGFPTGASAVSPDGSVFAVSPGPDRVRLWRTAMRAPLTPVLRGPVGDVGGLAFSPDGTLLAGAGSRGTVVWDTNTNKVVRFVPGQQGAASAVVSPDDHLLAIGGLDGIDTLLDLRTGRQTGQLAAAGSVTDVDFSPDGKLLASASLTGITTIWDVARQREVAELASPSTIAAFAVRFSPDGKLVAVGDSSGRVVFWDPRRARRVGPPIVGHGDDVNSVAFDPHGRILVTSSGDGKLRLWDVATRKLIGSALPGSTEGGQVRFFPDGKHVLAVFPTGTGILWNVDPGAWKARACNVARRNLTHAEWASFLGKRAFRTVCP